MMNLALYKRRRLRQKPHILTTEQARELGQLAGNKLLKHVTDQGLIPTTLFRLRKRKLELIYKYLYDHQLIHDKEPPIESLQTHQLAEYLLNIIYPGYPASRAKNQAYIDYRQCREKDIGQQVPLAYDYVPTTEVYERLDELYRIDVNWQQEEEKNIKPCIEIPISTLKKSMDRIRAANFEKNMENMEYHLYFWNSTRTLIKPYCKSLRLNTQEIWDDKKEKMVTEGFMHIDIAEKLKNYIYLSTPRKPLPTPPPPKSIKDEKPAPTTTTIKAEMKDKLINKLSTKPKNNFHKVKSAAPISIAVPTNKAIPIATPTKNHHRQQQPMSNSHTTINNKKSNHHAAQQPGPPSIRGSTPKPSMEPVTKEVSITFEIELVDHDEYNISHISISAVTRKPTEELVSDLYLQTTTECIARSLQTSLYPLDTQQIVIHLLKKYNESQEKLKAAENIFMTCLSNTFNKGLSSSSSSSGSEEDDNEEEEEDMVSLIDPISSSRIQHPVKSLHCRHRSCFDAAIFFERNAEIKLWHCPICFVHIKNIEELRMNYTNKVALTQYPHKSKLFVLQKDTLLSEREIFGEDINMLSSAASDNHHHQATKVLKRPYMITAATADTSTEEEEDDEGEENDTHHSKRYRAVTHVM